MPAPTMEFPQPPRPDAQAFRHPLDLIKTEHVRQKSLCDWLDALSAGAPAPGGPARVAGALVYLAEDLVWHTADEEEDLFPMLRGRCVPSDGVDPVLAQLAREHALDRDLAGYLVADLDVWAKAPVQPPPLRLVINAQGFAETQRRHLGWENSLILPLARTRLTPSDLESLGCGMAARRGVAWPA